MSSPSTKASHRDVAARADAAEQRDLSEIATPEPAPRARRRRPPRALVLAVLAVLFAVLLWVDVNAGYRQISLEQLWGVITGTGEKSVAFTLVNLRLPRVLTAMLVGIGLGLSGCLLQGVTRNDMAEPGVLGINAGAGLFVAAFFVFFPQLDLPTEFVLPALAFMGSLLVAFLDYRLAVTRRGMSPRRFLLVGIAIATAVSSFTTMLMLRLPDSDYAFVQNWIAGNIWGATWPNVAMLAIGLGVLALIAFYKSRTLNVLGLGEQTATGLGQCAPADRGALGCLHRDVESVLRGGRRPEFRGPGVPASGPAPGGARLPGVDPGDAAGGRRAHVRFRHREPHAHRAQRDSHRHCGRDHRCAVLPVSADEGVRVEERRDG